MAIAGVLLLAASAQEMPTEATFGTTVAASSGLKGDIYLLKPMTERLPNFKKLKPVGAIYTTSLNIPIQDFQKGFPGVTSQMEWFAIDYTGRFWVNEPGRYSFRLLSDDGAKLWIDDELVADNDGLHAPSTVDGSGHLTRGVHRIRLSYFQGPRHQVALVLGIAGPDHMDWRVFDTDMFLPPADPKEWVDGKISKVKRGENW